jgi:hypothetical protein
MQSVSHIKGKSNEPATTYDWILTRVWLNFRYKNPEVFGMTSVPENTAVTLTFYQTDHTNTKYIRLGTDGMLAQIYDLPREDSSIGYTEVVWHHEPNGVSGL